MKGKRRGLVIVMLALSIAGLLILDDVINQREIDDYNRSQLGEHIDYGGGSLTSSVACFLALLIVVIEWHSLAKSPNLRNGDNEISETPRKSRRG